MDKLGPWWQMPLAFLLWLIPGLIWGEYYLGQGLNQLIALMLFPFALQIREKGKRSYRFLFWSIAATILAIPLGNNIFVFMALAFGLLFILEYFLGKVGYLPAILFLLMTPFLSSWLTAFTFPLQLGQSAQIGKMLEGIGMEVEVHGNRFLLYGHWFSVDAACLGIHILSMGFFIATLILAWFEKRRPWSWWEIGLCLCLAAGLSYAANFARMFILVLFQSPANTFGHELTGLLAIGLFVGLPMYVAIWLRTRFLAGDISQQEIRPNTLRHKWQLFLPHFWTICLGGLLIWKFWTFGIPAKEQLEGISLPNHQSKIVANGIAQLSNSASLIYVKAPTSPWRADHHPGICWQGNGFEVQQIRLDSLGGKEVFKALLVHPPDTLHTAWWYDNGEKTTPHQLEWRKWAILGAHDFYLINVSKANEDALDEELIDLMEEGISVFGLGGQNQSY